MGGGLPRHGVYLRLNPGSFFQDTAPFFQDVLNKNGAVLGGQLSGHGFAVDFFRMDVFQDILNKSFSYECILAGLVRIGDGKFCARQARPRGPLGTC